MGKRNWQETGGRRLCIKEDLDSIQYFTTPYGSPTLFHLRENSIGTLHMMTVCDLDGTARLGGDGVAEAKLPPWFL